MGLILDDDFQSYSVGANPPYGDLFNVAIVQPVIQDAILGVFGDVKSVSMPALRALQFPTASPDNTLPAYVAMTFYKTVYLGAGGGTDEQGTLISANSNLTPFAGANCADLHIYSDGTLGVQMDGAVPQVSDFSLLRAGWYTIQWNVTFFDALGNLASTFEVGVNGISILSGLMVSNRLTSTMPAIYVNNFTIGGCGGGSLLGRIAVYDSVQSIGTVPHPGTPEARVTEGLIELVLSPDKWRVHEA